MNNQIFPAPENDKEIEIPESPYELEVWMMPEYMRLYYKVPDDQPRFPVGLPIREDWGYDYPERNGSRPIHRRDKTRSNSQRIIPKKPDPPKKTIKPPKAPSKMSKLKRFFSKPQFDMQVNRRNTVSIPQLVQEGPEESVFDAEPSPNNAQENSHQNSRITNETAPVQNVAGENINNSLPTSDSNQNISEISNSSSPLIEISQSPSIELSQEQSSESISTSSTTESQQQTNTENSSPVQNSNEEQPVAETQPETIDDLVDGIVVLPAQNQNEISPIVEETHENVVERSVSIETVKPPVNVDAVEDDSFNTDDSGSGEEISEEDSGSGEDVFDDDIVRSRHTPLRPDADQQITKQQTNDIEINEPETSLQNNPENIAQKIVAETTIEEAPQTEETSLQEENIETAQKTPVETEPLSAPKTENISITQPESTQNDNQGQFETDSTAVQSESVAYAVVQKPVVEMKEAESQYHEIFFEIQPNHEYEVHHPEMISFDSQTELDMEKLLVKVTDLEKEIEKLKSKAHKYKKKLSKSQKEAEKQNAENEKKVADLNQIISNLKTQLYQKDNEIRELKDDLDLESELTKLNSKDFEAKISQLEQMNKDSITQYEKTIQDQNNTIETRNKEIDVITKALENAQKTRSKHEETIKQKDTEIQEMRNKMAQLESDCENYKTRIRDSDNKLYEYRNENAKLNDDILKANVTFLEMQENIDSQAQQIASMTKELRDYKYEIQGKNARLESCNSDGLVGGLNLTAGMKLNNQKSVLTVNFQSSMKLNKDNGIIFFKKLSARCTTSVNGYEESFDVKINEAEGTIEKIQSAPKPAVQA